VEASAPRSRSILGIGLVGGLGSGLFGIGGGIVMIPAMVLLAGVRQHHAHAASLGAIIPIASAAAIPFAIAGSVDPLTALALAPTAVLGSQVGAALMARLSEAHLRVAFAALVVLVAVRMLLGVEPSGSGAVGLDSFQGILSALAIGAVAGIASALFGIGGGLVMVPLLVIAMGMPQHLAQGTSLLAIVPTALAGVRAHARRGFLERSLVVPLAAGGVAGALLASTIALRLDPVLLQRGFAVLLIVVALRLARKK
jgi:uncharacterized membrane protein YfcA